MTAEIHDLLEHIREQARRSADHHEPGYDDGDGGGYDFDQEPWEHPAARQLMSALAAFNEDENYVHGFHLTVHGERYSVRIISGPGAEVDMDWATA